MGPGGSIGAAKKNRRPKKNRRLCPEGPSRRRARRIVLATFSAGQSALGEPAGRKPTVGKKLSGRRPFHEPGQGTPGQLTMGG